MAFACEEMEKAYQHLTPKAFFELFQIEWPEWEDEINDSQKAIYELLKSGKFTGQKLLELGSGPTIYNIGSASAYFSEIVLSDFVEANCEELRKWLRGESNLDWSLMLNIVAKLEGHRNINLGREKIEARIRNAVNSVVHCDLRRDDVLPPEATTEYDFIVVAETLECAAEDYENYKLILKRINNLLRPGGGLLIIGYINAGDWYINGHKFKCLSLNQQQINDALDSAGFIEKEWTFFEKKPQEKLFQYDEYFNLVARKM